ncbi:transcription factor S-II-domain-containing protein [Hygrophoropsis aurantiaca]|uniref:Transcription factor S-II-domain-containing protein n=1 Tax=Hygrophoropsis aurantiaca TaxID=72124 RepID=A0ACB7ZXT2_9AGAM|nr:transcription factor S-II-domain-containing protein [Hygrophoropsis aurantiaca]
MCALLKPMAPNPALLGIPHGTGAPSLYLYDARACDSIAPINRIEFCAKGVEAEAVYLQFVPQQQITKGKSEACSSIRKTRVIFLFLYESTVSGELSAEMFSKMSSEEMYSQERKAADQKIKDENFFKSIGATEWQEANGGFQCARCKQRRCRYRQAQTRSADEPMTTFVHCVNCGHDWRFS